MFVYRLKKLTFRQRFVLTLVCLVLFRIGSHIILPFVSRDYLGAMAFNDSLSLFNTLTGGAFERMSLMALGVTPYITASIIIQLLSVVIPKMDEMRREGPVGQKIMEKWTRRLGLALGFLEALGMMIGYGRQGLLVPYTWYSVLIAALCITAGVGITMFLGYLMTEYFFGNGISLLLFVGIVAQYLSDAGVVWSVSKSGRTLPVAIVICCLAAAGIFLLFMFTYWLNGCEKKIPIVYNKKLSRDSYSGTYKSSIPLKLMAGSVVPVIFASAILTLPALIQSILHTDVPFLRMFNSSYWFSLSEPWTNIGIIIYCAMIIGFSYFYSMLNMNTIELADNLRKQGCTIPGIRQGKSTQEYLDRQLRYLTLIGGLLLCVIALVPNIVAAVFHVSGLKFLGTSVIITVSVAAETLVTWDSENKAKVTRLFYTQKK